jgi:threonine synthase
MNDKFIYRCTDCSREYSAKEIIYLCPSCSEHGNQLPPKGVLKVVYDFVAVSGKISNFDRLSESGFFDLLPIASLKSLPPLRIGNTPLYKISNLDGRNLPFSLFLKDDSQNPTFSFKDRASALVSAFAMEKGLETIVAASTGNAGSSIAGICASQGQKAIVIVPASAPAAKLTQIVMYGAKVIPVAGTYDDAFDLSIKATGEFGWYNRNTAYNPLTIEGKKTVSFELFDQMNESIPDRIFVPVGDGVIISGVYKGFEDLLNLNIIDKMPVIVAVQAEGSDNLVKNLNSGLFQVKESHTIADSISVNYPRNFFMTKKFLTHYYGEWITISDEEILSASAKLARNTGIFTEPAAAAAYAGFLKFFSEEKLTSNSRNVVLLTGSGLKDIQSVQSCIQIPEAVQPDLKSIAHLVNPL